MNSHVLHFATKYGGEQYHLVGIKDGKATRYDGPHDDPEGVAEARKLHDGIWPHRKPDKWLMVVTSDVPDLDPPVNDEAMEACRMMVERAERRD